jgi:two-component system sensor histidine kinase KdpD
VEELGGSYHQVVGEDIPSALLAFARAENATQLVLGASRRSRIATVLTGPGIGAAVTRHSGDIDVHLVTHDQVGRGLRLPVARRGLTARRRIQGGLLAVVALGLLTVVAANLRHTLTVASILLLFQLVVVSVALVGGMLPALGAAVLGSLLINYFFTPPLYTFTISEPNNALALLVFVVVAAMVSAVVDLAARRTSQASRARAEAETLSTLAGSVLRGETALPVLLERVRETFALRGVSLLERESGTAGWTVVASVGEQACLSPADGDAEVPIGDHLVLAVRGRSLAADDRRLLTAFAATAATALEQHRLADEAAAAAGLADIDATRRALLTAVSHDLRTPLASAKAAVSSLLGDEVAWAPEETEELLHTADDALDTLSRLVVDLLDLSRLQAGALSVLPRTFALDEVVPLVLDELHATGESVRVDVPETLPEVVADPMLLERVLANLLANALRLAPEPPPVLTASVFGNRMEVRVVDRGPGVPEALREQISAPFQRLGDTDNSTGVGLGLALARGLSEAMGGSLTADGTPGGGLTMTISLPVAPGTPAPRSHDVPAGRS